MYYKYSLRSLFSLALFFPSFFMSSNISAMDMSDQSVMPGLVYEDKVDRSLRLKVTNLCPFTCNFCHNEGTELPARSGSRTSIMLDPSIAQFDPVEDVKVPDIEDMGDELAVSFMSQLDKYKSLGYDQVHLTGGEPSAHLRLPKFVKILKENGFTVKMTSNGQFNPKVLDRCVEAGLSGVTFSRPYA